MVNAFLGCTTAMVLLTVLTAAMNNSAVSVNRLVIVLVISPVALAVSVIKPLNI